MKRIILLTLLSRMSFAAMAGDIPDFFRETASSAATPVYERMISATGEHLRIYNAAADRGFVLTVDDKILGYSTDGTFSVETAPPALLYLLETMDADASDEPTGSYTAVSPLSSPQGPIMWNQDSPFNDLCPMYDLNNRCPSGCVATAMAQVMYYNRWPLRGTGSHTYSPAVMVGNTLTADFGNTEYNWDAMLPDYFSGRVAEGYTIEESRQTVARLMLHCGVAVDMVYYTQSGATDYDVPPALVNYFGYDSSIAYRKREHYSTSDWLEIINNELLQGRMVLAYGRASSGGHAFVFDGMDSNGYIHVNWGWGGMSNGYFATSVLTPATQGIGGADGGFNYSQRIITGIRPAVDGVVNDAHVELTSTEGLTPGKSKIQQGASVTMRLSGKVTNHGWQTSTYDYGLLLMTADGDTVTVVEGPRGVTLAKDETGYAPTYGTVTLGTLAEGEYTLYPVCRVSSGTGAWIRIRDSYIGYPNCLRVKATATDIIFETPDYFNLAATSLEAPATLYAGLPALIKAEIVNNGDVAYHGEVRAVLRSGNSNVASTTNYIIDLAPDESASLRFTDAFNAPAGEYRLVLLDDDGRVISSPVSVNVATASARGTVTSTVLPEILANSYAEMSVKANIKVEGGDFNGLLYAFIYNKEGNRQCSCLFPEYVSLRSGDNIDVVLKGTFENGLPDTEYMVRLATYNGTSYTFLDDELSATTFVFMSTGAVNAIDADDEAEYLYFDLLGRPTTPNHTKIYKKLRLPK